MTIGDTTGTGVGIERWRVFLGGPPDAADVAGESLRVDVSVHDALQVSRAGSEEQWESVDPGVPLKIAAADGGLRHVGPVLDALGLAPPQHVSAAGRPAKVIAQAEKQVLWVGDFDSAPEDASALLTRLTTAGYALSRHALPRDKDVSDYGHLLDLLGTSAEGLGRTLCLRVEGALGGRRDHEWVNVQETIRFLKYLRVGGAVLFGQGIIFTTIPVRIRLRPGSVFTLLTDARAVHVDEAPGSTDAEAEITLTGALYEGTLRLARPSHGLSNAARDSCVTIFPHACVVTFLADDVRG